MDNKDFLEKLDTKIDEFNKRMTEQEQKEWIKIRAAWKAVNDVHAQLKVERMITRYCCLIGIISILVSGFILFKNF